MTAVLTATTTPALRPVPWHRLGWVAWRRYRATLVGAAAFMGLLSLYLFVRGSHMRSAYVAAQGCRPQSSAACNFLWNRFSDTYGNVGFLGGVLVFVPAVLGAFAGAPLLARELETGTFRFAWTQGAGRMRWLLALVIPGVLGVAAVSGAFGVLVSWYEQPLIGFGDEQRLHPAIFPVTGLAVVGWAVLAYALGLFAGLVSRRVLAALAATLAVWFGLAFYASSFRKYHYEAPLLTSNPVLHAGDDPVGQWWTHNGVRVDDGQIDQALRALGFATRNGGATVAAKPGAPGDPFQYLMQHGYTQWTSYQPASRYWPFQWIEFGWLMVLSLLLLGATVWLVRRRGA
jgi:hypothetical protein